MRVAAQQRLSCRGLPHQCVQVDALKCVHDHLPRLQQLVHPNVLVHKHQETVYARRGCALVLDADLDGIGGTSLLVHPGHHVRIRGAHPHRLRRSAGSNRCGRGGEWQRRGRRPDGGWAHTEGMHERAAGVPAHALQPDRRFEELILRLVETEGLVENKRLRTDAQLYACHLLLLDVADGQQDRSANDWRGRYRPRPRLQQLLRGRALWCVLVGTNVAMLPCLVFDRDVDHLLRHKPELLPLQY
mmetsp:Transcript_21373/g.48118  ORF Transcript_21373/g.48118 Transcript_21373/m.48118 type:complete len:244 (-) Transcript_21373:428-1159(-)